MNKERKNRNAESRGKVPTSKYTVCHLFGNASPLLSAFSIFILISQPIFQANLSFRQRFFLSLPFLFLSLDPTKKKPFFQSRKAIPFPLGSPIHQASFTVKARLSPINAPWPPESPKRVAF